METVYAVEKFLFVKIAFACLFASTILGFLAVSSVDVLETTFFVHMLGSNLAIKTSQLGIGTRRTWRNVSSSAFLFYFNAVFTYEF